MRMCSFLGGAIQIPYQMNKVGGSRSFSSNFTACAEKKISEVTLQENIYYAFNDWKYFLNFRIFIVVVPDNFNI